MGIGGVIVGQIVVLMYYAVLRCLICPSTIGDPAPHVPFMDELREHVTKPESFLMTFGYLTTVWTLDMLPETYYDLDAPMSVFDVGVQFLIVDFFTYIMHRLEHAWTWYFRHSHRSHHQWVRPRLLNAFNGSVADTFSLIVVPLFLTSQVYHVSTWSFMVFGSLYAAMFTLIHSEYHHPWDPLFAYLGLGTAADHHVHHALFKFNFGHFTMYFDRLFGTYRRHTA